MRFLQFKTATLYEEGMCIPLSKGDSKWEAKKLTLFEGRENKGKTQPAGRTLCICPGKSGFFSEITFGTRNLSSELRLFF